MSAQPSAIEVCEGLLYPIREIALVRESNGPFQNQVFLAIKATGKSIDDMTVRELRELIEQEDRKFSEVHA